MRSSSSKARSQSPFFRPNPPRHQIITTPNGTISQVKDIDEEAKSSILGATFNLCNNIVGAGIVSIPFAISQCSFFLGIAMVVLFGLMTVKSLRLLIETAKHIDVPSYERLAEASFGRAGFTFISVAMFIMAYGGMVGYLMIIKGNLSYLLGVDGDNIMMKNAVLVVSSLTILFPISLQRDMGNLAKTSTISVIFDIILVGIIAYFSPVAENVDANGGLHEVILQSKFDLNTFFTGIGVLCFAFVCQHSSFIIASSLERPTKERWNMVTGLGLGTCTLLAVIMGTGGYLGFLCDTDGDILINLGKYARDAGTNIQHAEIIARGLLCMTMFFVYPMELFVARHVCVVLLFQGRRAHEGDDHAILARRDRRVTVTTGIYLLTLLPALIANDLGQVFAISGALGGATLSYLGPGVLYIAVHGSEFLDMVGKSRWGRDYAFHYKYGRAPFPSSTPKSIFSTLYFCSWYILLMPLWCRIATHGNQMLKKHEEEEAKKSPFPYAFGKILHHKRKQLNIKKYRNPDIESSFRDPLGDPPGGKEITRADSLPALLKPMNSYSSLKSLGSSAGVSKNDSDIAPVGSLSSMLNPMNSYASLRSLGSNGVTGKIGFKANDSLGNALSINEKEHLLNENRPITADSFHAASFKVIRPDYGSSDFHDDIQDNDNNILKDARPQFNQDFESTTIESQSHNIEENNPKQFIPSLNYISNVNDLLHEDDSDGSNSSSGFVEGKIDDSMYESDCEFNPSSIHVAPSPIVNFTVATVSTYSKFHNVKADSKALNQIIGRSDEVTLVHSHSNSQGIAEQDEYENDPQDLPPTVLDFGLAIFYVLFGFVAAFAGLFSAVDS